MNIQSRLSTMKLYKSLTEQPDQPKIKHIMYTLGIKGDLINFLNTPAARGIITIDITQKYKDYEITSTAMATSAMDSWLSALYYVIWKPRNLQMNNDFPIRTNLTTAHPHFNLIHRTNAIDINIPGCNIRSLRFKINITPPQPNKRKRTNLIVKPRTRTRIETLCTYTGHLHMITYDQYLPTSIYLVSILTQHRHFPVKDLN